MSTLAADYAVPLLGWLTMELGMSLAEMRNVSRQGRERAHIHTLACEMVRKVSLGLVPRCLVLHCFCSW